MAEYVQRSCENMIQELEMLRRLKLFTQDEINRMIVVKKIMESKIHNKSKHLDDFKKYIAYEKALLKKIKLRRKEKRILAKKGWLNSRILFRIRRLYQTSIQLFRSEYSFHLEFFKFCREHKFNSSASQAIDGMIKMFSNKPGVWMLAAKWYQHLKDNDKALQALRKGFTFNPQSIILYNAAIKLELEKLSTFKPEERQLEEMHCCFKLETYVSLILKNIKYVQGIMSTLEILCKHEFTKEVQEIIKHHVKRNFHPSEYRFPRVGDQEDLSDFNELHVLYLRNNGL